MRIFVSVLLLAGFMFSIQAEAEPGSSVTLEYPPESLANWYKPVNKRQVWLHTMFRLRRSLHAIEDYATDHDIQGLKKWTAKLEKDYSSIGKMVPEWTNRTRPGLITDLNLAIEAQDKLLVKRTLKQIRKTCDNCHADYRPLVAALYRSPKYEEILVKKNSSETTGFVDAMNALPRSINRILIALEDNQPANALRAAHRLTTQINHLGGSCNACHKDNAPILRIMGSATQQRLDNLVSHLKNGQVKESRKLLGEIGVSVCARCHSIHRTLSDLRNSLEK